MTSNFECKQFATTVVPSVDLVCGHIVFTRHCDACYAAYAHGDVMPAELVDQPSLPMCELCNQSFNPNDPQSENGEYHERRELQHKEGWLLPWQRKPGAHPYTFCSADCEYEAVEQYEVELADFRRDVEAGEYDVDDINDYRPAEYFTERGC